MFLIGVAIRSIALVTSLRKSVLKGCELADLEHDTSFACFPEILMIWDSVSERIRQHLAQDRVSLTSSSSLRETLRTCLVRTTLCHRVPSLPHSDSGNSHPAGHYCQQTWHRPTSLAPAIKMKVQTK